MSECSLFDIIEMRAVISECHLYDINEMGEVIYLNALYVILLK